MDVWEKFNKPSLPEKEEFYSNLNIEVIRDIDYMHAKRVWKDFEIKKLGKYYDLYFKSDTLLLVDVFTILRKMRLKMYHLDLALAWQAVLKKAEVKSKLLTDIDMLLTVEKGNLEWLCHAIYDLLYIYDMN